MKEMLSYGRQNLKVPIYLQFYYLWSAPITKFYVSQVRIEKKWKKTYTVDMVIFAPVLFLPALQVGEFKLGKCKFLFILHVIEHKSNCVWVNLRQAQIGYMCRRLK